MNSLPTTAAAPSTAAVAVPGSSYDAIPRAGRGWDAKTIYIGYVTQNDFNRTVAAAGYSAVNAGDQVGDIEAVIAAINKSGGLFGRKVVGVDRDNNSGDVSNDPEGTSGSNCQYFLHDRPVVAVLNLQSALDTATFRSCMSTHTLPVMSLSIQPITQSILQSHHGYVIPLLEPTYDRVAPVLMRRLVAQRYFTGWDVDAGKANASRQVKTGFVVTDDAQGHAVEALMVKALKGAGYAPDVFRYAASGSQQQSDMQAAVLRFRSDGVTHVLGDSANLALFMVAAGSQSFHPRYGLSSYNAAHPFLTTLAPPNQLIGAVGVGSAPFIDVAQSEDPGDTPGKAWCRKVLRDGGQDLEEGRFSEAVAYALCDGLRAAVSAAQAGGGLTGPELVRGMALAGPGFPTSFAFRSGLAADNSALPGGGRDWAYLQDCSCFRYVSKSTYPI